MTKRTVLICPECDSSRSVNHRITHGDYRCYECGATFDEPKQKDVDRDYYISEAAQTLIEADREQYP